MAVESLRRRRFGTEVSIQKLDVNIGLCVFSVLAFCSVGGTHSILERAMPTWLMVRM